MGKRIVVGLLAWSIWMASAAASTDALGRGVSNRTESPVVAGTLPYTVEGLLRYNSPLLIGGAVSGLAHTALALGTSLPIVEVVPPSLFLGIMASGWVLEAQTACEQRGMVRATEIGPDGEHVKWEQDPARPWIGRLRCVSDEATQTPSRAANPFDASVIDPTI